MLEFLIACRHTATPYPNLKFCEATSKPFPKNLQTCHPPSRSHSCETSFTFLGSGQVFREI